jgi:predicted RNA-binding protein YlqC (UPF0109 family)
MRVWKISDQDCPICAEMATFDAGVAAGLEWGFGVINFDFLSEYSDIRDYVRVNFVATDGSVDIPIYVIESEDGRLIGGVQGRNTKGELRRKLMQAAG